MAKPYPLVNKDIFELIMWLLDPKAIEGALKSAVHAHGPIDTRGGQKMVILESGAGLIEAGLVKGVSIGEITTCGTSSAAKRIRGALKTRAIEYLQEHGDKFEKKVEESV